MLLPGKTVVLTGANKGIGYETLKQLISSKVKKIFACVRNIKDFNQICNKISDKDQVEIIPIKLDLSDLNSTKDACAEILEKSECIDILINNAGIISSSLIQMTTITSYKEIFEVNFFNQVYFTQNILKKMNNKEGGSIIFVSSTSATDAVVGRSAYSSSKSSINSFAITLSREVGRKKIRVNVVSPGLTNTNMMKDNTPQNLISYVKDQTSLKRVAAPEEIAKSIIAICSDYFSYMTGQILRIDGGI